MIRFLVCALVLCAAPRRSSAQALPSRIDSLAQAFMAETAAPSLVVGVSRGGVRTVVGYGAVGGVPPDASTRYEIGSVTKTFTALALAEATVQGDARLDTPVQALLPDSVHLAAVGRPVTLEDLATHHAGLPRLPTPFVPASMLDPYAGYTEADLMRFLASVRLDSAGAYAYSNAGAGLLAYLLARHQGGSVGGLLASVTGPLGLTATSTTGAVAPPRTAGGMNLNAWTFTEALAGAGALRSNAADLLAYAEALARPEARAAGLVPALRLVAVPRASVPGRFRIGLAWHLLPEGEGPVEVAFHNGATFGSVAFVGVVLEADVSVVLLANTGAAQAMDTLAFGVLRALAAP